MGRFPGVVSPQLGMRREVMAMGDFLEAPIDFVGAPRISSLRELRGDNDNFGAPYVGNFYCLGNAPPLFSQNKIGDTLGHLLRVNRNG